MRRSTICFLALSVAACGSKRSSDSNASSSPSGSSAAAGDCKLPEGGLVKKSLTLPKGCALSADQIVVSNGATLTLEPGVKITFSGNGLLQIEDGQLLAKGTSKDNVILTGANKGAGSWVGIIIGGNSKDGSVLDHVVVEFAGKQIAIAHGALTAYELDQPKIAVTNSTFRDNGGPGLDGSHAWSKVTGNTFLNNAQVSIRTSAVGLAAVGKNKVAEPIVVKAGTMETSGTWPALGAPIIVEGALRVGKEGAPVVLTIETGAVVRTKEDALYFGNGSLIAKGVTFTSNNMPPAEGDWRGLVFEGNAAGSVIDACTIEFAGKENAIGPGAGVILYETPELGKEVKVTGTTFKRNKHGGIRGKGCASAEAAGNKSEGTPLCAPE